jgi:hypothetical protein
MIVMIIKNEVCELRRSGNDKHEPFYASEGEKGHVFSP